MPLARGDDITDHAGEQEAGGEVAGGRVLCFPWGWGGAAAYTTRCIAVAEALAEAGCHVAFADTGISSLVEKAGFQVLRQTTAARRQTATPPPRPTYLPFANPERVFATAARYYRRDRFQEQLDEDSRLISEFDPSLVVLDMMPTAAVAARARGLPVVAIADTDYFVRDRNSWMPWIDAEPEELLPYPSCHPVINEALHDAGLGPVAFVGELLTGHLTLVPSVPELEPDVPSLEGSVRYVGPLLWEPPDRVSTDLWEHWPAGQTANIYVTLGSGVSCSAETMASIMAAMDPSWNVFVSAGLVHAQLPAVPRNVRFGGFTGLRAPLEWCDAVVHHGGVGTTMATLMRGRPAIVIPFTSEQELNGRRLVEEQGAGQLVRTTLFDAQSKRLRFVSRHSGEVGRDGILVEDVATCLREVLTIVSYRQNAERIGQLLGRGSLSSTVVDEILRFL